MPISTTRRRFNPRPINCSLARGFRLWGWSIHDDQEISVIARVHQCPLQGGTCRAPVTLCAVTSCDVFAVRKTTGSILESVYRFYGVEPSPDSDLTLIKASKDRFSEETGSVDSSTRGAA
jgi:hypothetical protein